MTNSPLLDKFYELYPEKKEQPKPKPEPEEDNEFYVPEEILEQINNKIPDPVTALTTSIIPTSNTYAPIPPSVYKIKTYDLDDVNVSFQQVAEKIKNGEASVSSVSMERDIMGGTKMTFEIIVYEP